MNWVPRTIFPTALAAFALTCLSGHATPPAASENAWIATWAAAPQKWNHDLPSGPFTYRNVLRVSVGGTSVRIRLTNLFGSEPLQIHGMHISSTKAGTVETPVLFAGQANIVVPAGKVIYSDATPFALEPLERIAVSLDNVGGVTEKTCHALALSSSAIVTVGKAPEPSDSWCFVDEIDVRDARDIPVVAVFGDSIADGKRSTFDEDHRWPDFLAARLRAEFGSDAPAVINAGISGNRVLHDGLGTAGVVRFARDVLDRPGVKYVVLMEGLNDISRSAHPANSTALIAGWSKMLHEAHERDVKVYVGTLTPFDGNAQHYSVIGEQTRQEVNAWLRSSHEFDGVIDFDRVLRDPASPSHLLTRFDSGDHIHPNDDGYRAMAAAVPLDWFRKGEPK